MLKKTNGIILRGHNFGEADRVLEVYSDSFGKIRVVAKGVRRIKSRLAGHVEPFMYAELMVAEGRGDLSTLAGARAIEQYEFLRRDLKRVAAASYIAELVSRLTPDGQVSRRFPELLREALTRLNGHHNPARVVAYYEWQAVAAAGWEPDLYVCAECGKRLYPQGLRFSLQYQGVLCKECHTHDAQAQPIQPETVKLLRCVAERSFEDFAGVLTSKGIHDEAKLVADSVVHTTLDREPRSRSFLSHIGV